MRNHGALAGLNDPACDAFAWLQAQVNQRAFLSWIGRATADQPAGTLVIVQPDRAALRADRFCDGLGQAGRDLAQVQRGDQRLAGLVEQGQIAVTPLQRLFSALALGDVCCDNDDAPV